MLATFYCICMLASLPSHSHLCIASLCPSNLYAGNQFLPQDGHKSPSVGSTVGVKQWCPLSPLLMSLFIDGIGMIAKGVQGAVTGSEDVRVTHLLYAHDLNQLVNAPGALQTMLNRLLIYAHSKHLTINTAKSEVGCNVTMSISIQSVVPRSPIVM